MKRLIATLFVLAFALGLHANSADWLTDFDAAKKKAAEENKPILMLFTGSDWCPSCIKWEKETFGQPEFENYAKDHLVLLFVDFPEKKKLPKEQAKANNRLLDKFKIQEYPTAVLLNPKGKKLAAYTYTEGGPKVLLGKIGSTLEGSVAKKQ
jgi:protein disulfide-isomerase